MTIAKKDGWQNELTGLATYRDKRNHAVVKRPSVLSMRDREDLYAGDDVARKIIELPADEMARGGGTFTAEDADRAQEISDWLNENNILRKFRQAQAWANLHGGAAILLGVPGDQTQPLTEDERREIRFMTVFDACELQARRWYEDPLQEKYGHPETFSFTPAYGVNTNLEIHESRLLIFEGLDVTRRRRRELDGWGESVLVPVCDTIRDFDQAWGGIAVLLQDWAQPVFKIRDLAAAVSQDKQQLIKDRLVMMDMARSLVRAVVIDGEGEEFERKVTPLTGLPEVVTKFETRLASAARMPATVLFGKSPDGMNATGDSDMRIWYDRVNMLRDTRWKDPMHKVLKLCMNFKFGSELDGWQWNWANLWEPSDAEKADTRLKVAQTDNIYWQMGELLSGEIRDSRFGGDEYSMETSIDPDASVDEMSRLVEAVNAQGAPVAPESDEEAEEGEENREGPAPKIESREALNGAQVTAMVSMMQQVASRQLPRETGVRIMAAAFNLEEAEVSRIMGDVGQSFFLEEPEQAPNVTEGEEDAQAQEE